MKKFVSFVTLVEKTVIRTSINLTLEIVIYKLYVIFYYLLIFVFCIFYVFFVY